MPTSLKDRPFTERAIMAVISPVFALALFAFAVIIAVFTFFVLPFICLFKPQWVTFEKKGTENDQQ